MKISVPNITRYEIAAVTKAMSEGDLSTGRVSDEFEKLFTLQFRYKHAVSVNSGTSALYLSLLAYGIGPGDEVIVSPYTFVATVNVIILAGATPVFADIERGTYNIDPEEVVKAITPKTKAVIPVSIFGVPCDVPGIREGIPPNVKIIEDAIEAVGAIRNGKSIGRDADCATFGFFPNKQITTGEGGMVVSEDATLIDNIRRLSRHGVMDGDIAYQMAGHNMRMSDINAAIGSVQLLRLTEMQRGLAEKARLLDLTLGKYRVQITPKRCTGTHFNYVVELPKGITKYRFILEMAEYGIPVKRYFDPVHLFNHVKPYTKDLPVAEEVGSRTVSLPFHHELTLDDIAFISTAFNICIIGGSV